MSQSFCNMAFIYFYFVVLSVVLNVQDKFVFIS